MVCVNKYDLNLGLERRIRDFCADAHAPVTDSIPFDQSVSRAIRQGVPLVEFDHSPASMAVSAMWQQVIGNLMSKQAGEPRSA